MKNKNLIILIITVSVSAVGCGSTADTDSIYRDALAGFYQQDLEEAETLFLRVVKNDRSHSNAFLMLSKISYYKGEYERAVDFAEKALKQSPGHSGALYWMARSLIMKDKNNTGTAIDLLRKSLEGGSGSIRERQLLALLYEKEGRYKEAFHQYYKALRDEEVLVNIRVNLALLYDSLGMDERGSSEIEKAVNVAKAAGISDENITRIKSGMQK